MCYNHIAGYLRNWISRFYPDYTKGTKGEMEWTRAFHNTGRPHNSILRSTYSGHVRSGSLDS